MLAGHGHSMLHGVFPRTGDDAHPAGGPLERTRPGSAALVRWPRRADRGTTSPIRGTPGASARTTTCEMGTRAASIPRMDRARQGILAEPRPVVALIVLVAVATAVALAAAAPEIRDVAGRDPGAFVAFGLLAVGLTFTSVEIYGRGAVSFAGCGSSRRASRSAPAPRCSTRSSSPRSTSPGGGECCTARCSTRARSGLAAVSAALVYEAADGALRRDSRRIPGIAAGGLRLPDDQPRAPQLRHGALRRRQSHRRVAGALPLADAVLRRLGAAGLRDGLRLRHGSGSSASPPSPSPPRS